MFLFKWRIRKNEKKGMNKYKKSTTDSNCLPVSIAFTNKYTLYKNTELKREKKNNKNKNNNSLNE